MKMNKTLLSAAVAVGLLSTSTVTHAAGFQLAEYSATGLGRAYAGEAAIADNAGSQWRNPALLTYLEGTQVSVGAIYVDPNIDIDGTSTSVGGASTTPSNSSDFAHSAVIPNFYVSHKYNEKFALGFAAGTNYGMETDLGKDFGGANHGNEASVISMELNLNAAYQVLESLSIGGGVRYIMAEGSFGAVASSTLGSVEKGDTLKYMEGDDTAWGWQVGTAWQINENNRLGFTYKSEVDLTLKGHAEGAGFELPQGQKRSGSMELALPATAELASFHQLTETVAIHASINWTNWSSFKELVADFPTESVPIKEENWEDNYRFAIGTTYQMTPKLALRSGIAYDTSAVSEEHRTATIPETDRTWLSIGAGYQWSEQLTLDAGFTYILAKDAKMHESDLGTLQPFEPGADYFGGSFEGEVTGSIWLVGIQANYRF
ncbi:outer membrane protein transport protein [Vibrio sp. Sgm 22]|uniref:outer membrane protein transport protein n=1 Tax=unclassified Vibrio TaxID=2614977 RepID=UPI002249720B|nr:MULTISPECIES: outer membrane protein transport protein [unclassified Vibrio]MCX2759986.1 outer membrane protein transport protein [Vibrio sp. 14G-20]MCX2776974.1 outer membrane protein transport protein [Vibrio sp. Sgm 22]